MLAFVAVGGSPAAISPTASTGPQFPEVYPREGMSYFLGEEGVTDPKSEKKKNREYAAKKCEIS